MEGLGQIEGCLRKGHSALNGNTENGLGTFGSEANLEDSLANPANTKPMKASLFAILYSGSSKSTENIANTSLKRIQGWI